MGVRNSTRTTSMGKKTARRLLLCRGQGLRFNPDALEDSDKNIGVLWAMIGMTTKIRWGLKQDRFDKEPSEIDKWENGLGVKEGVYKRVGTVNYNTEEE